MSTKKILSTIVFILASTVLLAQTKTVKGVVYEEETGETIPGASVMLVGSTKGTVTDINGAFTFSGVKPSDRLQFDFFGKEQQLVTIGELTNIVVKLKNSVNELDDAVVVAFGKQKKESVIGSITSVDVSTLKVPSSNLTTSLAGNVAGVIAYQRSGEPGQDNADFFVRGITTFGANTSPLILIDNIELTSTDLARLQPDDIESFSVMKDATATALYGARGANGVIFVTTKRGQEGPAKIFARVETSISQPTDVVEMADPVTFMKSFNEAITTRDPLGEIKYTYDKIEQTGKPGANRYIYPYNDWYDMLFKDYATSYRANVSARGGGSVAQYYVAGAFTEDTGILKVDNRNSFNNNIDQKTYTLRSNVDINVTKTTKLAVRLTGNFTDYTGPLNGGSDVYKQVVHSDPVLFPAYYPLDEDHVGIKHILALPCRVDFLLQIFFRFLQCERRQSDGAGHTVVQSSLVTQQFVGHPCCSASACNKFQALLLGSPAVPEQFKSSYESRLGCVKPWQFVDENDDLLLSAERLDVFTKLREGLKPVLRLLPFNATILFQLFLPQP